MTVAGIITALVIGLIIGDWIEIVLQVAIAAVGIAIVAGFSNRRREPLRAGVEPC
jgi:hypothetical protein